jgi:glucose uptake protein GlcU
MTGGRIRAHSKRRGALPRGLVALSFAALILVNYVVNELYSIDKLVDDFLRVDPAIPMVIGMVFGAFLLWAWQQWRAGAARWNEQAGKPRVEAAKRRDELRARRDQ